MQVVFRRVSYICHVFSGGMRDKVRIKVKVLEMIKVYMVRLID